MRVRQHLEFVLHQTVGDMLCKAGADEHDLISVFYLPFEWRYVQFELKLHEIKLSLNPIHFFVTIIANL